MGSKGSSSYGLASLDDLVTAVRKQHGAGAVMRMTGDDQPMPSIERITTGSIALDHALGGGLPRGRIVEVFGPESCGKSTLALAACMHVQRAGGRAWYIDAEHALDPDYCTAMGIITDELHISQPSSGEEGLQIALAAISSGAVDLVVVDSVAALTPRVILQGEIGDVTVGAQARLMSQALTVLVGSFGVAPGGKAAVLLFINQLRMKINAPAFSSPEDTPGGKALKFYASVRLDVRRTETLKDGSEAVGSRLRVKAVKNKTHPPLKNAEFDLLFGRGISREGELVDLGVALPGSALRKSGAWYIYEGAQIGQGKANACAWLSANPAAADQLEAQIREQLASGAAPAAAAVPEPQDLLAGPSPFPV